MHLDDASSDSTVSEIKRKNYKSDINNAAQYTRWFLEILGVWPMISKNSSKMKRYFSKVLMIMCVIAMSFILVPTTFHIQLREKNMKRRIMQIGPVVACFASILKHGLIIVHHKTIKNCIEHMKTDWMNVESDDEREIMTRNAKIGRSLTVLSAVFLYSGGFFYNIIMPLLKGTKLNQFNETVRPLVYKGFDIFVESQNSPNYEIIFCVTCVSAFVRYTVTIAACNLAAVFVTHTCGQIQIVILRLRNLFDGIDETRNNDMLQKRISSVVQCHENGLRLSSKVDEALRDIILVEVGAVTPILCLLGYYLMTEWENNEAVALMTYFLLLVSYVFNIFILCHIGELLMEQSQQVGYSTYMIEWYRLPGKTGLALIMIIAMANYPRKISAGRMMELSLHNFGIIIKSSMMYLNMLRAVTV